ncbi:MAG: dockerin type I repeat-containing protein [Planctomycetota bacterium]
MSGERRSERIEPILAAAVTVFVLLTASTSAGKYSGGTGEPNDPYMIETPNDLNDIGNHPNDWDKHFKVIADIDLGIYTGTTFNTIGYWISSYNKMPFSGVFDGNNHTISNLTYSSGGTPFVGLFAYVNDSNAVIEEVRLSDANIDVGTGSNAGSLVGYIEAGKVRFCCAENGNVSGNASVGGLVGKSDDGRILNCHARTSVWGRYWKVGGLVGNNGGTISNCYASGNISGNGNVDRVGGLVGVNGGGTISDCYALGNVSGGRLGSCIGGLVGRNESGTISGCYASGDVSGSSYLGGLIGDTSSGPISNCYAMGSVSGDSGVGGLVGRFYEGPILNCYSVGSVSGNSDVGGLAALGSPRWAVNSFWDTYTSGTDYSVAGEGKTTIDMQTAASFATWVCQFVWTINEGIDYPRLVWENKPGEMLAKPSYGGGNGSEQEPYLIYTAEQLNTIGLIECDLDKHFMLMADIDLSGYTGEQFNMIGVLMDWRHRAPFTGVFDGNGHVISSFTYDCNGMDCVGLFAHVEGPNALIQGVTVHSVTIAGGGGRNVGPLVGHLDNGRLVDCQVDGGEVSGTTCVGGLVGCCYEGGILGCSSTVTVSGDEMVGGLVGYNPYGRVSHSYAAGSVSALENVGGLVGYNTWYGTVSNCHSSGNVFGGAQIGGLVGQNYGDVYHCYSIGQVSGDANAGGLVGQNEGDVHLSFWDVETSGQETSSGGTGKTTGDMQTADTFLGWGCEPMWTIDEGRDYPRLVWEKRPGEILDSQLTEYVSGSGEPNDPYLIGTNEQLNLAGLFDCEYDKHFKLTADIDLSTLAGRAFNRIGTGYYHGFSGVFDGDNRVVYNFTYESNGIDDVGLFGYICGPNAVIKDLGLVDPNVNAGTGRQVGSLGGTLKEGIVTGCWVRGGSVCGGIGVGGLIGHTSTSMFGIFESEVSNCFASTDVCGERWVGGLVGFNGSRWLTRCFSSGNVRGKGQVGGLVGLNNDGHISDSYSSGSVEGESIIGGLVGDDFRARVSNCYSTSSVSGTQTVGGLVGDHFGVGVIPGPSWEVIKASFWDVETSGQTTSAGGVGLTTAQMQSSLVFTAVGWDFVGESANGAEDIWSICEGADYPKLTWQFVIGDFDGDNDVDFADFAALALKWLGTDGSFWCGGGGTDITNDGDVGFDDLKKFGQNWLVAKKASEPIHVDLEMNNVFWMYQNLPGSASSNLTAEAVIEADPLNNSGYSYEWKFVLPDDVSIEPDTVSGGGPGDASWTFAAPGCDQVGAISDLGQAFEVQVTVRGNDYGNSGTARGRFGVALLGDVNNDCTVDVADRSIVNAFLLGVLSGPFSLRDCDVNCDEVVDVADRSIVNAIWKGALCQNRVGNPCPCRPTCP